MEKETIIEKVSGNVLTNLGATAFSAVAGGPLAALLPALIQTPAARRHKKRIEKAFEEINKKLEEYGDKINEITDLHYKFVNEVASTILRTVDKKKIEYLKKAIQNGIEMPSLDEKTVTSLSRTIRDITTEEVAFLLKNISYKIIYLDFEGNDEKSITIYSNSDEREVLSGLLALGLVIFTSKYVNVDAYYFSDTAFDIVNIFKD